MSQTTDRNDAAAGARRTLVNVLGVVAVMGGLSFAAVPFYDMFCRVTGFAGTPQRADAAPGATADRVKIEVLFDASTHRDMPWRFDAAQPRMEVALGESVIAFYRAENPTDETLVGTASFNVSPPELGAYFTKIECFCFTEQVLAPGETVMMPVTFFVDPDLLEDAENKNVRTVTLSYTMFLDEDQSAAAEKTAASAKVSPAG